MAIYKEILDWSENKPLWIRDSLRRLISNVQLSEQDIQDIFRLLKKETGFTGIEIEAIPISKSHLPTKFTLSKKQISLSRMEFPVNINALHSESFLEFCNHGLNVVYGGNGSGKSSYVRVLKKVCWCRDKSVIIKKNVYSQSSDQQEIVINYSDSKKDRSFTWHESGLVPDALKSIYVFDISCANMYVNNENPIEYKPVGLDLLERLIGVCIEIADRIDEKISQLKSEKPVLDDKFSGTEIFNWYIDILEKDRKEIQEKIVFTEENSKRLKELSTLLSKSNPEKENRDLEQKINRYSEVLENLEEVETAFNKESIKEYNKAIKDYGEKREAYLVASKKYEGDDPLSGVGSETWRILWEAAKNYAITEVHPDNEEFPSGLSKDYCVFCQQKLQDSAISRLERFNSFISDTTSTQFQKSKKILSELIEDLSDYSFEIDTTTKEISSEVEGFEQNIESFQSDLKTIKRSIISSLRNKNIIDIKIELEPLSKLVATRISEIRKTIRSNLPLIKERSKLSDEWHELSGLEELYKQKKQIQKYYEENLLRYWLEKAKLKTNTRTISQKIGEIQENTAIQEQHQEFVKILSDLNYELAQKIVLRKTRTDHGATYQQCTFGKIDEPLNEILSEGEQKIIAISNFIAECTIDGSKNSVVIDDPVTSLDHNYIEKIAEIVTKLSVNRQVILFTHDLNFVRLLIDKYKKLTGSECCLIGLKSDRGFSGILTDEIPYLAKNIQERIDTIRKELKILKGISPIQTDIIDAKTELIYKWMRFLLEKTIEDILANNTIQRFRKNINIKAKQLSSFVVTAKSDIDFILKLYGKYSTTEHDGGVTSENQKPTLDDINKDLSDYDNWKKDFKTREQHFISSSGY